MKKIARVSVFATCMVLLFSCDYDTTVLNIVHKDGSVTRKVTMENSSEYFEPKNFRVPVDSTWNIEITSKVSSDNDTTWFLTAEKHFNSVAEINEAYKWDKGTNRTMERRADFSKKFRWFTTLIRYSETVERALSVSCPISDFISDEALKYFYLPGMAQEGLKRGPDSLKYRAMDDQIEGNFERWLFTCETRQWVEIFYDLFGDDPRLAMGRETMNRKEPQFINYLAGSDQAFEGETLLPDSMFMAVLGPDFFAAFRDEIAHSMTLLHEMNRPVMFSSEYDMEIRMPGRIIASNGYAATHADLENEGSFLFSVGPEYYLTQDYELWVQSRVNNYFFWVITGIFVAIVITGLTGRYGKRDF